MRNIVLGVLCTFALPALSGTASADEVVITEISKTGYNVANYLRRQGDTPMTAKMAETAKRGILSDTMVDAGEQQMIDSLLAGETFTVRNKFGNSATVTMTVEADARAILQGIEDITLDDPILQLWTEGTESSVGQVVAMYQAGGDDRRKVEKTLGNRAKEVFARSNYADNYKPLRTEFAKWGAHCYELNGQSYSDCREMLFEIVTEADKDGRDVTTGNIPDFLYDDWKKD